MYVKERLLRLYRCTRKRWKMKKKAMSCRHTVPSDDETLQQKAPIAAISAAIEEIGALS